MSGETSAGRSLNLAGPEPGAPAQDVRVLRNPQARPDAWAAMPSRDPLALQRRLPGYQPTPLADAPRLAAAVGVGRVRVKDESSRLGLNSFKMLGASWASYRALAERLGTDPEPWQDSADLIQRIAPLRPLTLTAATDGNHGRAVARVAAMLGLGAKIFVPDGTAPARIHAIESEGASVEIVPGGYDDAVARSAAAGDRQLVISDTSWPGYEKVPRWIIDGYSTIFWEIEEQVTAASDGGWPPDLVAVQIGVGALAAAAVVHFRRPGVAPPVKIVGVEPASAACALESARAGHPVTLRHPQDSIMAGLNCGTPSPVAWPVLAAGVDVFVAISDSWTREAMRELAAADLVSGESGAAGLAGLLALLTGPGAAARRADLGVDESSSVLVISTEGATDPESYRLIVGSSVAM
jgi:diaminopropionate ammonia-lyase